MYCFSPSLPLLPACPSFVAFIYSLGTGTERLEDKFDVDTAFRRGLSDRPAKKEADTGDGQS
jgi:hypothetical protein